MKKYIKVILFLGLIVIFNSCTDVIDVDVPNHKDRLVVEASINWKKGTEGKEQTVVLGMSTSFFGEAKNKEVLGAKVLVLNDVDGEEFLFLDQNDGTYKTLGFVPQLNQSYTLRIEYEGKVYEAKETMAPVGEISNVSHGVFDGFGEEQTLVRAKFSDEENIANYYLATFLTNDTNPEIEVSNDRLSDGNENSVSFIGDYIATNDIVNVKLYGISRGYFNYMRLLLDQAGESGGGPFSSTPARLYGNCKNINDKEEEVLGYFRLSEYDEMDYIVKEK